MTMINNNKNCAEMKKEPHQDVARLLFKSLF